MQVDSVKPSWLPASYELTAQALEMLSEFFKEPREERKGRFLDVLPAPQPPATLPRLPEGYEWVEIRGGPPIPF